MSGTAHGESTVYYMRMVAEVLAKTHKNTSFFVFAVPSE